MRRYWPVAVLVLAAAGLLAVWLGRSSGRAGPLTVTFLGSSNPNSTLGYSTLEITNRSSQAFAYLLEVETQGSAGWGTIRYQRDDPLAPQTSIAGWVSGGSNALLQIAAPQNRLRYVFRYQRVPSRLENYVSWTLASVGIRSPFAPRKNTVLIYPKLNEL